MWTAVTSLGAIALTIIGFVVYFTFDLLASVLSNIGAGFVLIIGLYYLLHKVCIAAVFPGSVGLIQHQIKT
jgi:hypothetical protein